MSSETALIAVENSTPARIFSDESEVDRILADIRERVRAHEPDTATAKGRAAIASLAHKVARSKTLLDEAGKALNADKRKEIEAVDAYRRKIRAELDRLKAEARRPLDEWEEAEEKRKAELTRRLAELAADIELATASSGDIDREIARVEAIVIDESWQEREDEARDTKDATLARLYEARVAAVEREQREAELARLRAEQEERERKEREERERVQALYLKLDNAFDYALVGTSRELAAQIEEVDRVPVDASTWQEFAEQAAARKKRALEALRTAYNAAREREDREREEAQRRAEREAAERARREKEEAERREREAEERAERARQEAIEAERRRAAEEEAERKRAEAARAADVENRKRKNGEARDALVQHAGVDAETAQKIVVAIFNGEIPHIQITY